MRLLVVEDDEDLARSLARGFRAEGFTVSLAVSGPEALSAAKKGSHDAVILDVMLPGVDGFEVLRELRAEGNRVPVLFLTAREAVQDRLRAFGLGGDDYISKPFSFEELLARVRAVLRRAAPGAAEDRLGWKELVLDRDRRQVTWKGDPVPLTPTEYAILEALLQGRGRVFSRESLLARVFDDGYERDSNVLDVHLTHLRRKLRAASGDAIISTVRGQGFWIPG